MNQYHPVTGDDPDIHLLDPNGRTWKNTHWYLNDAGKKRYAYTMILKPLEICCGPVPIDPRPSGMYVLVDGRI